MHSSSLMLRRFCSLSSTPTPTPTRSFTSQKKQLVFLGSPQVSVSVLDTLFNASSAPDSLFEEKFLSNFRALEPELCITAAYGNILPSKFLKIPSLGTVNVHPSLLPLYRGAAPVQRALEDGMKETGVSLAFTVRALDAGPVIARESMEVDDHIKAPELLELLFGRGSELLIRELPSIFDGSARVKAQPQDDSKSTLAPKITPEESWLSFDQEASVLHNKGGQGPGLKLQCGTTKLASKILLS